MIKLKIKIKSLDRQYSEDHFLNDDYMVSKQNAELEKLVSLACKNSHIEDIQDVKLTASFEW